MSKTVKYSVFAAAALIAAAAAGTLFLVSNGSYAVVVSGGRRETAVLYGPGLHWKWPFSQQVFRIEDSAREPSFENSLVLAPVYVQYLSDSDEKFRMEAGELKRRLGGGRYVLRGFSAFLNMSFPAGDLRQPIVAADMEPSLRQIDTIVERARNNGIVTHVSLLSGFFHGWNELRGSAIRADVRNAQWFADGLIAPEGDLVAGAPVPQTAWVTPSRYAEPLRRRIEEGTRIVGAYLAGKMAAFPETLLTVAGDGEVELSYERNFARGAEGRGDESGVFYTDYSPFMIAEFRDTLRAGYAGDASPAADDDGDGRTFNRDFQQTFSTWQLRYFDGSGPIPWETYLALPEKLPGSGPYFIGGGFDAPREPQPGGALWEAWLRFRSQAVANWVGDFAGWMTGSPDPATGARIPPSRFYSYQIPADFLFGARDNLRLTTSGSPVRTAFIGPMGSPGITAFNAYNGEKHSKTARPELYTVLADAGEHWGLLEYNPVVPNDDTIAFHDSGYIAEELKTLYAFRPHVLLPFAWSDHPYHRKYSIKDSAFEAGLRDFLAEEGDKPWFSWKNAAP